MNQTFTQHVVMPRHTLRSESKDAEKHHKKQRTSNLIYSALFCCKILLFGIFIQGVSFQQTFAQVQNVMVKGTVVDDSDGQGIPGITISDDSRKVYGVTNENGTFSVTVPIGTTIKFSMIGYGTVSRTISATVNNMNIRMKESAGDLNEVVVTALGIKREQRSLGYATTKIDSNQLTDAVASNWTEALSGKVAGLNLVRSNSGPGGSNKIILRGENNLTGDNEALIVIDGVVVNNGGGRRTSNGSDAVYGTGSDNMPADYGSTVNDINPEDIESVTILKGPGAAALYGQRGANGAVIITTKSANANRKKGVNIKFTSNGYMEEINRSPDLQYEYGQGLDGAPYYSYGASADGASTSGTSSAYGPRFDGQSFFQYDPATQAVGTTRTPWVPYDNINTFFNTGYNILNTLSVDGSLFKGTNARISISNQDNRWIVPKSGLERTAVNLNLNSKIGKNLTINTKFAYSNRFSDNLPGNGYGNQSIMYWYIFWQPNADLNWLRNYWVNGQYQRAIKYPFSSFPENPFAIVNEFVNRVSRNNYLGNVQATYNFTKELSFSVRASMDLTLDNHAQERPYDAGTKLPQGSYREQNIYSHEISGDFMLRYNKKISENITLSATAGGSQLRNKYQKKDLRADGLKVPNIYRLENNLYPLISIPDTAEFRINSFYAATSFGFKSYLYLDLTARQDWSSVLATPNRTDNVGFFYPSASVSFIASDFWKLPKSINYAKFRFSASQVGSGGTTPYRTAYNYVLAANGTYPDSALVNPGTLPNNNLKPLKTTTYEVGFEGKFFKSKLGVDLAYYMGKTNNQILTRIVDRSSGYNNAIINSGQVNNTGFEAAINFTPISKKGGFSWTMNGTFSTNKNKIVSLPDSSIIIGVGPVAGGQIVAKVGGSMGDLYGRGFVRDPEGNVVYDANTGFAKITSDVVPIGNTIPKYKFGFQNTFSYGNVSVGLLFDAQIGGVAHSLLNYKLVEQGKLQSTVPGRYNGIIGNGVIQNPDGSYRRNDVIAYDVDEYYRSQMGADNAEGSTFKTDFIKFREATINWRITKRWIKNTGLSSVTIGVFGRNLFIWSPWPMFDPEFGTLSGSDIVKGFEIGQFPSTRSYGFNLSIGI
jgi:TonB-linked SusC/RagA family outer membrane protein